MRFGFCTGIEHSSTLAAIGYDYIEPPLAATLKPEEPEPAGTSAPTNGLSILPEAFNVFLPSDLKVVGEQFDEERQQRYVEAAFARAAALGGKIVVFGSGGSRGVPDGFPRMEARRQVIDFLKRCGAVAGPHEMTLAIEPLNKGECNFINSVSEAVELALEVDHPSVRVLSDLYHVSVEGQTLDETRAAGPLLTHVHVAGAVGRRAPNASDHDHLARFFSVLKQIDYTGRISAECQWSSLAEAETCLAVLRSAWDVA